MFALRLGGDYDSLAVSAIFDTIWFGGLSEMGYLLLSSAIPQQLVRRKESSTLDSIHMKTERVVSRHVQKKCIFGGFRFDLVSIACLVASAVCWILLEWEQVWAQGWFYRISGWGLRGVLELCDTRIGHGLY